MSSVEDRQGVFRIKDICNLPEKKSSIYINSKGRVIKINPKPASKGYLNISKATLFRWIKNGYFIKPFKVSKGTSFWYKKDVDKWLDEKKKSNSMMEGE
ncbi:AlpA family phage regulatory protein [Acinetobacter seifertii]|uniref:AlpA family phage regulatory protein n=1 Tax=Acinetobacter seifertii TaxID=1530123 RepID=A0A5E9PGD9_9GAMM|nr:AlpA family phage regulatory protein [Acinetobacter seifertii]TEU27180.1 AlpA family phage regulatory protein [Acinetobacter seifertii]